MKKNILLIITLLNIFFAFSQKELFMTDYVNEIEHYQQGINTSIGNSFFENRNINHNSASYFQNYKRAIVILFVKVGSKWRRGSGVLVNTVQNSFMGSKRVYYILSANHVLKHDNYYISFNYEMSHATDRGSDDANSQITKVYKIPFSNRILDEGSDLALLEIDIDKMKNEPLVYDNPDKVFYNAFALGWNLNPTLNKENLINISHPRGDVKKIFENPEMLSFSADYRSNYQDLRGKILLITNGSWDNAGYPQRGSSGSPLMDKNNGKIFALLSNGNVKKNIEQGVNRFSSITNLWINQPEQGFKDYLDPDESWISSVSGGYISDLIQNLELEQFDLDLSTAKIEYKVIPLLSAVDFYRFDVGEPIKEKILGDGILLSKDETLEENQTIILDLKTKENDLLYQANYNTNNYVSDQTTVFKGKSISQFQNTREFFKNQLLQYLRTLNNDKVFISSLERLKTFEIQNAKLSLTLTNGNAKVRAVKLPYIMPYNSREIFEPGAYDDLWQSYKYRESSYNSEQLSIESIKVSSKDEDTDNAQVLSTKSIITANNGGYLNLVNPNYMLDPIPLSVNYTDANGTLINVDRYMELDIKLNKEISGPVAYSVWIDYWNRDTYLAGKNTSDNSYNFIFDGPGGTLIHLSELFDQGHVSETDLIDGNTIRIRKKLPDLGIGVNNAITGYKRMRISVKEGTTPPSQNEINETLAGEVEDYSVNITLPNPNSEEVKQALKETIKRMANIWLKNRKQLEDQDPDCNSGNETGDQLYDETGQEDNTGNERTCSTWEGPCKSSDICDSLFQQDPEANGGEYASLTGNNRLVADIEGIYTQGDFSQGMTVLTTYRPTDPLCETCNSEYIFKQGSILGDNDGDSGGDGNDDGWGLRLNPDAEEPTIELDIDVNNQQEIIEVPINQWLAEDPNQWLEIIAVKNAREISLLVKGSSSNYYKEANTTLNTAQMLISEKVTIGGGQSTQYSNTKGEIDEWMFEKAPANQSKIDILFNNATKLNTIAKSSQASTGKSSSPSLKLDRVQESDFSIYPNPASDKLNILVEVKKQGPLQIDIYDMNGRQVYSMSRPNLTQGHQLLTLPIQNLSAGNYILKIRAGDVVRSEKVFIN